MNVKIQSHQHEYFSTLMYKEYLFGSQLHGIANENSDFDYIRVINDSFYDNITSKGLYLPNLHSWQYDDGNAQYIWMTNRQFYQCLFSGDGNMLADVVLLSGEFEDALFFCRTYKIIKGYIGVAKRDLKLHRNVDKKKFHALRSLYMAEILINNELPTVEGIKKLHVNYSGENLPALEFLVNKEQELRDKINQLLEAGELSFYPHFKETNEVVQIMINANNLKEFKY